MASKRRMTRVVERNRAPGGRDWVVGDVHGCFTTLREALRAIDFEHGRDRVFSVGDLIDRDPNSIEALEWLAGERFEAVVMGNHEAADGAPPADRRDSHAVQGVSAVDVADRSATSCTTGTRP